MRPQSAPIPRTMGEEEQGVHSVCWGSIVGGEDGKILPNFSSSGAKSL